MSMLTGAQVSAGPIPSRLAVGQSFMQATIDAARHGPAGVKRPH